MIVVLGRPRVHRPEPDGPLHPAGLASEIALAVARAGRAVELVGSIGDDPEGDRVVVELGRAGVGHAALLRDPATRTPTFSRVPERGLPRLDAADVELGLRYVPECRVLVVAAALDSEALARTQDAAAYHGAALIVVAPAGGIDPGVLAEDVTVLERPAAEDEDTGEDAGEGEEGGEEGGAAADDAAFGAFVADYALRLERGQEAADAFAGALGGSAWERSADDD